MTTNLQVLIPEITPAQWKLLERTILDCLPKLDEDYERDLDDLENAEDGYEYGQHTGYKIGVADCTAAITNVFNGDKG